MKNSTILLCLLISLILIQGCASDKRGDFPRNGQFGDMTEEERQQMMEERQQIAIDACTEKNEGDICTLEAPRGDMEGRCQLREDNLICMGDVPIGERPIGDRPMRQG